MVCRASPSLGDADCITESGRTTPGYDWQGSRRKSPGRIAQLAVLTIPLLAFTLTAS